MNMINGVNNLGGMNAPDGSNSNQGQEEAVQQQNFDPSANVMAHSNTAASMARLEHKKNKRAGMDDENENAAETEHELEVATLGMVQVDDERLAQFSQNVQDALLLQEKEMQDIVNTFAGNEKTLRNVISTLIAS